MNITSLETFEEQIEKIKGRPRVFEILWDGDTRGWFMCLFLYVETKQFFTKKLERHSLGSISFGSDLRILCNEPLEELPFAKKLGQLAIEKYQVEFYFPSPDQPDNCCPKWSDRDCAIHCADCDKLIIPTDSTCLPKNVCYNCHHTRQSNERLKSDQPDDTGVPVYLNKEDIYRSVSYSTYFKDGGIARFVNHIVDKVFLEIGVNIIVIGRDEILKMRDKLAQLIDEKLQGYEKPVIEEKMRRFVTVTTAEYKGRTYELFHFLGKKDHAEIGQLIGSFNTAEEAISEGFVYQIFFKKGFTYRDDLFLRFINYVQGGSSDLNAFNERYGKVLNDGEIMQTLYKLEAFGCVIINDGKVKITQKGKCLV